MEILTNFETLTYIYLALTVATLIYPVELLFRANFVNFIFMVLLTTIMMITKLDLGLYLSHFNFLSLDNKDFLIWNGIILGSWILFLRFNNRISELDSLFLGLLPFIVFYYGLVITVEFAFKIEADLLITSFIFYVLYAILIYNKLLITLPYSVKTMSDSY